MRHPNPQPPPQNGEGERRFWLPATLAVTILLGAAATWAWAHAGHAALPTRGARVEGDRLYLSAEARTALDVRTAEVETRTVGETVLAQATLAPPWRQHGFATSRLPGRIVRLLAQPGDVVAVGQPLAEVQSAELEDLQLEVRTANNDLRLAKKVVELLESGDQAGVVSGQKLEEARSRRAEAASAVEIARSKWLSLDLPVDLLDGLLAGRESRYLPALPIRSPVAGVVIHGDLTLGRVIEPYEHLFEVVDLSAVWVELAVLESDLGRVGVGQSIALRLAAYPGEIFAGRIEGLDAGLDLTTHRGTVWFTLANPPGKPARFLPGMVGEASIALPATPRTAVPVAALIRDGAERYVLVEAAATVAASEYEKRNVVVFAEADGFVQVTGAVYPGDRVVTRGSRELAGFFFQSVLRPSPEAARSLGLEVHTVTPRIVEDVLEVDGAVELPPEQRVVASAQMPGVVRRILVERGQTVQAGDVLAEIDSLELRNAQLELLKAHLQTILLDESLRRLRTVGAEIPRRQFLEAESAARVARDRRDSLRRKLELAGLAPGQIDLLLNERKLADALPLRAAVAGRVVRFDKGLGQAFKAEEPLFEVHDLSHIRVRAHLSEAEFARAGLDPTRPTPARVRLTADPTYVGVGRVIRGAQSLPVAGRTLSVWVELSGPLPQTVREGLLARVALTLGQPAPTLAVPQPAVVREGGGTVVFVRQAEGNFVPRSVRTGRRDDRFVEILDGLQPGETVAVGGAAGLRSAYAVLR